jgi:hypothetical protein
MKTIIERFNAPTPDFFKKLRNWAIVAAGTAGTILALPVTFPAIVLPAVITTVCSYLVAAGAVAASVGQLAKSDAPADTVPVIPLKGNNYTENELPPLPTQTTKGMPIGVMH